jgi:hypothetical protein
MATQCRDRSHVTPNHNQDPHKVTKHLRITPLLIIFWTSLKSGGRQGYRAKGRRQSGGTGANSYHQ